MPARARRGCDQAVMSSPPRRMRPAVGTISPESRLTSVDLPAPLVPMTACTSPRRSASETSLTAASPPKRRVRAWASRRTSPTPPAAAAPAPVASVIVGHHRDPAPCAPLRLQADETLGHGRDERDDRDAEGELPVVGDDAADEALGRVQLL